MEIKEVLKGFNCVSFMRISGDVIEANKILN